MTPGFAAAPGADAGAGVTETQGLTRENSGELWLADLGILAGGVRASGRSRSRLMFGRETRVELRYPDGERRSPK